jgi:hypothetical protein
VRIPPSELTIPPTPPPDIDVEAWRDSLQRIAEWRPERLAITHFGAYEDVDAQLSDVGSRLDAWAERARTEDQDTFIAGVRRDIELSGGPDVLLATYAQAAPPDQLHAGLERYWRKRSQAVR